MKNPAKSKSPAKAPSPAAPLSEVKPANAELVPAGEPVNALSIEERNRLTDLEKVIEAKLGDFFEVGSALMEIKQKKLFRSTHDNFDKYCQTHWGMGRSYANKLIECAERISLLPAGVVKPTNEFQIRPLLKFEAEEFPQKWGQVLGKAGSTRITAKTVKEALGLSKKKRKKRKSGAANPKAEINQVLDNIRAALNGEKVKDALKELEKLEKLLKG